MLGPPRATIQKAQSISVAEEMKAIERNQKELHKRHLKKKKVKINYAELLNMKVLKRIRKEFLVKGEGDALACDEFCEVLSEFIPRSDVESLYKKIDINDDGMVEWEEFTGFLISSEGGGTADMLSRNSVQQFVLQREQPMHSRYLHSDMIEHIAYGKVPFPVLVTAGLDGQVLLWNPKTFQYINTIDHRDKSEVFLDEVKKSMSQADVARMKSRGTNFSVKKNKSYITSVGILPITGHICLCTADCCVTVYDSPSLEITGRMTSATDVPTAMQAFAVLDKIRLINTQYIAVGNSQGKIVVIMLDESFVLATDGPLPKKKNRAILEVALKNKYKWKIHQDWVTQIMYIKEINRLVSASLDGTIVLSTMDPQPTSRIFRGHGAGVRCFAWSNASKILCSAGTDRSILIWDPFTLQIAHRIENLNSMIISIHVNDLSQQIVFVMQDKTVKTWDSLTYENLATSEDPSFQLPKNEISSALWVPGLDTLITAGSRLCAFKSMTVLNDASADEDDDLCKALYNVNFYEVITVSKGGWVNVYYVGDGSSDSAFLINNNAQQKNSEGKSSLSIVDAILDKVQRRLIVATSESNEIQLWNFHSGQCLKIIRPRIVHSLIQNADLFPADKKSFNITCLHYEHSIVGNQKSSKRMLMFGTDLGVVSILIELPDDIAEEPATNLVAQFEFPKHEKKRITLPPNDDNDHDNHSDIGAISEPAHHNSKFKSRDVLWICESSTNNSLVGYANGTVIDWNLEKGVRNATINAVDTKLGTTFLAYRRKFAASSDLSKSTVQNAKKESRVSGSMALLQTRAPRASEKDSSTFEDTQDMRENDTQRSTHAEMIAPAVDISPIGKKSTRKPSVRAEKSLKLQPKVRSNGPRRISTGETSRTLLATYGNHYEKQVAVAESGQESWTTSNHNGYFKSAIVGVAKKSQNEHPSLNPLLPDVLSPRHESEPFSISNRRSQRIPFQNFGRPRSPNGQQKSTTVDPENRDDVMNTLPIKTKITAWEDSTLRDSPDAPDTFEKEKALIDNQSEDAVDGSLVTAKNKDDIGAALQKMLPQTPLTHSKHAQEQRNMKSDTLIAKRNLVSSDLKLQHLNRPSQSPSKIGVVCVVPLKMVRIMIGACTDSLFRFWDLDNANVICSCSLGLDLKAVKEGGDVNAVTRSDMQLTCMCLSPAEDLLFGGYENGEIRIWIISMFSISNIRNSKKEAMSSMSVPPIQLLNEWTAHESSLRSIEVVLLDENNWGSHEIYVVSSGQDQAVHMWTVNGEHVGTFGASKGWDLDEKSTWKSQQNKYDSSIYVAGVKQSDPSAPSRPRPSYWRKGNQQKIYKIDPADAGTNFFRMAKLNRHMEKVKIKNQKKLTDPSTTEIHCNMIYNSQSRNPIVDVQKDIKRGTHTPVSPSRRAKSASFKRSATK